MKLLLGIRNTVGMWRQKGWCCDACLPACLHSGIDSMGKVEKQVQGPAATMNLGRMLNATNMHQLSVHREAINAHYSL
jgi:hypothetical protein